MSYDETRDRMLNSLYEPSLRARPARPGTKLNQVPPMDVAARLIDELGGLNNNNRTATDAAHTANGVVLEATKRVLHLIQDLGFIIAVAEPLATTEEVEAAGLDATGRDGDVRFPYTKGDLVRHQREIERAKA